MWTGGRRWCKEVMGGGWVGDVGGVGELSASACAEPRETCHVIQMSETCETYERGI